VLWVLPPSETARGELIRPNCDVLGVYRFSVATEEVYGQNDEVEMLRGACQERFFIFSY
jgi:hypothetical protein